MGLIVSEAPAHTDAELTSRLKERTKRAIQCKRWRMGLKKQNHISWKDYPEKAAYITANRGIIKVAEIAKHLGLTYCQVKTWIERSDTRAAKARG
jgi:predicted transcriptional regulator